MNLKKIYLAILLLTLSSECLWAQSGVDFKQLTWEEAKKEAIKQNKFLFVDVVISVKSDDEKSEIEKLADKTLAKDSISGLINDNFISIVMDMSSEEGKTFGPNLSMLMFPTYVFYNAEGDQIGNSKNYELAKTPKKFIDKVYAAIQKGELKKKNDRVIDFLSNNVNSWEEVLAKAAKANKPVFIDIYTTWCRPCIQMDRDIFTLNEVADFHNNNFINLKLDGEKTYGSELVKQFNVKGFPTFIYVDTEGKMIYSASGFKEKDDFLKISREASKAFGKTKVEVNFNKLPFKEIQEKSKAENKPIFFDAYTTWCGPCKKMDKEVFNDEKVANFFNDKFINAKFDMEKGEGPELGEKYNVQYYPTYLFLDSDGSIIHSLTGFLPSEKLIAEAKKVLEGGAETLSSMDARFDKGERSKDFMLSYIEILNESSKYDKAEEVADVYLNSIERTALLESNNWKLFNDYIRNPYSELFGYLLSNLDEFKAAIGEKPVSNKVKYSLMGGARAYFQRDKDYNLIKFDKEGFTKYLKFIKNLKSEDEKVIMIEIEVLKARETSDWKGYVKSIEKGFNEGTLSKSSYVLYNYALVLNRATDLPTKTAYAGAEWVAECMTMDSGEGAQNNYLRLYADLLEKSGNKTDADKARQQIK